MADQKEQEASNKARSSKSASKKTKSQSVCDETQEKAKPFRWNSEKVSNLLKCLQEYKTKLAYQGLDFDADRPLQYRMLRKEMAKMYESEDPLLFGPVEICTSDVPVDELSKEEKEAFLAKKKKENDLISRGHTRIQEKVKEIRQSFSKAVTAGTRSGSGKIVYEFYDELVMIWGGSPSSEPLSFGVGSATFSASEIPNGQERDAEIEDNEEGSPSQLETCTPAPNTNSLKRPARNAVPKLIDNKRKHLEKALSAAQRDQILLQEAKEDKETRRDLASSMRESSQSFNAAMQNISGCISQLANGITRSIEMLSQAILVGQNQPPTNQNLFYQTHGHGHNIHPSTPFQFHQQWQRTQSPAGTQQTGGHTSHVYAAQEEQVSEEDFYQTL